MRFLIKSLFLNIPLAISLIVLHYTNNQYYLLIALEFNILFIAGMDNAISIVSENGHSLRAIFEELIEKLDKHMNEG